MVATSHAKESVQPKSPPNCTPSPSITSCIAIASRHIALAFLHCGYHACRLATCVPASTLTILPPYAGVTAWSSTQTIRVRLGGQILRYELCVPHQILHRFSHRYSMRETGSGHQIAVPLDTNGAPPWLFRPQFFFTDFLLVCFFSAA